MLRGIDVSVALARSQVKILHTKGPSDGLRSVAKGKELLTEKRRKSDV